MQEPIQEADRGSISLSGLERVFEIDSSLIENDDHGEIKAPSSNVNGLTIKEASKYYGFAVPTIRMKIKTGALPAKKVEGPKGPEWRVFPQGLPVECSTNPDIRLTETIDQPDITLSEDSYEPDSRLKEGYYQANINIGSLIKANQELSNKLEAANYRIGYLEAQTENHKEQIKLLTDSQNKLGWWARFSSWFMGVKR